MSKDNTCVREQYTPQDSEQRAPTANIVTLRNCGFGVVNVDWSGRRNPLARRIDRRNRAGIRWLIRMEQIKTQLIAEIKQFEAEIDAQKRVIKHSITKGLAVEDAEQNLKQLRTRLSVLQTNLKKCDPEPEGDVA